MRAAPASLVARLGWLASLAALPSLLGCPAAQPGTPPSSAPSSPAPAEVEALPPGPLVVLHVEERIPQGDPATLEEVSFRDARGAVHALRLGFTSYPIAPTALTLDGRRIPQGPAWARLGRSLRAAGLSGNATILLLCFGGDAEARC